MSNSIDKVKKDFFALSFEEQKDIVNTWRKEEKIVHKRGQIQEMIANHDKYVGRCFVSEEYGSYVKIVSARARSSEQLLGLFLNLPDNAERSVFDDMFHWIFPYEIVEYSGLYLDVVYVDEIESSSSELEDSYGMDGYNEITPEEYDSKFEEMTAQVRDMLETGGFDKLAEVIEEAERDRLI